MTLAERSWADNHTTPLFERMPDFRQLLETCDPRGKFRDTFDDEYVFGN